MVDFYWVIHVGKYTVVPWIRHGANFDARVQISSRPTRYFSHPLHGEK